MGGRGSSSSTSSSALLPGAPDSFNRLLDQIDFDKIGYLQAPFKDGDKGSRFLSDGLNATPLQLYIDSNDLYGEPSVLDDNEFSEFVRQNPGVDLLTRGLEDEDGLTGADMFNQFIYGDRYYVGEGFYGDGTYFARNDYTAVRYATRDSDEHTGSIVAAALRPGAKVVGYDAIKQELTNEFNRVRPYDRWHTAVYRDDSFIAAYAMSRGYDAIVAKPVVDSSHIVVLNRSALVVNAGSLSSGNFQQLTGRMNEIQKKFRDDRAIGRRQNR